MEVKSRIRRCQAEAEEAVQTSTLFPGLPQGRWQNQRRSGDLVEALNLSSVELLRRTALFAPTEHTGYVAEPGGKDENAVETGSSRDGAYSFGQTDYVARTLR
jgi:hypothetical protein